MTPMVFEAGSTALAAVNLAGLLLIARHRRWGWLVLLGSDVLALPYQMATWQYGFLVTGVISTGIAAAAFTSWGHRPGRHRGRWRLLPRSLWRQRSALIAGLADARPEPPRQVWTAGRAAQFETALRREPLLAVPTVDGAR